MVKINRKTVKSEAEIILKNKKFYILKEDKRLNKIVNLIRKNQKQLGISFKDLYHLVLNEKINGKTISKPTLKNKLDYLETEKLIKKIFVTKQSYLISLRGKLK